MKSGLMKTALVVGGLYLLYTLTQKGGGAKLLGQYYPQSYGYNTPNQCCPCYGQPYGYGNQYRDLAAESYMQYGPNPGGV